MPSARELRRRAAHQRLDSVGESTTTASCVVASAVGYSEAALEYFIEAFAVDLRDTQGNTADGVHIAACGGTWLALVAGFDDLRDADGEELRLTTAAAIRRPVKHELPRAA